MNCARCGKSLGGADRVFLLDGNIVCHNCARKSEPVAFTNGRRALKAARKRALADGSLVTITIRPDENLKRVRYYVRVKRRESGPAETANVETS